ncbi:hypothetical protein MSG28_004549 [Choristoneura fumiferana]|uniref:Uncharacterized protein n=1 Tax=Choristoneura fumiferana TaxID=7141 RepID=A0ACC0K6I7_CHOFU|nr:hypothetical protein MSG28_004549 [Choristoneura fumiferana]
MLNMKPPPSSSEQRDSAAAATRALRAAALLARLPDETDTGTQLPAFSSSLQLSNVGCPAIYIPNFIQRQVVGPCACARSARITTTILLANPAVKQQCLHCCVSAWRCIMAVIAIATVVQIIYVLDCNKCPSFAIRNCCGYSVTAFIYSIIMLLVHAWFLWGVSKVAGPCARSARIATTILLANPALKQ